MGQKTFIFKPREIQEWKGRYTQVIVKESAYHVNANGEIIIVWSDGEYEYKCPARKTSEVSRLGKAVNNVKRRYSGHPGGAFRINEFGQVISPVMRSNQRFLIGAVSGVLEFEDPWNDGCYISLADDEKLKLGDRWGLPYIGNRYNLSKRDEIYFWKETNVGSWKELPSVQDIKLIEKLRRIRPYGAIRFMVNEHGIVLTKSDGENSEPVYVGRINYDQWFEREE